MMRTSRVGHALSSEYVPVLLPDDDSPIDFQNAVLYVGAFQAVLSTVLCAITSLICCWAMPTYAISTIRTLVISSLVSVIVVSKPFRIGRVHGLSVVFGALRPCCAIYIGSQILEQLIHTCTRDVASPSWRRIVFHALIIVCIFSGFARARKPLQETDMPFLVTIGSLFLISMLPPPAVMLSGPYCSNPTLWEGAERIVRSFVFASVYCVFVYTSSPPIQSHGEIVLCVMRSAAASIWTLGCHAFLLPLALLQCILVIFVRISNFTDKQQSVDDEELERLTPSRQPASPQSRCELEDAPGHAVPNTYHSCRNEVRLFPTPSGRACSSSPLSTSSVCSSFPIQKQQEGSPMDAQQSSNSCNCISNTTTTNRGIEGVSGLITPSFSVIGPRSFVDIGGALKMPDANASTCKSASDMTNDELAAIAALIPDSETTHS